MLERGIHGLLPAFFAQIMIGQALNGYSKPSWVDQIQVPGQTFKLRASVPLDEEESTVMEAAMTELRMSDPQAYRILELHWGYGWTDSKIARSSTFKSSRVEIERQRIAAQHRLEARIAV